MRFSRLFGTKIATKGALISLVSVASIAFALIFLSMRHADFADRALDETMRTDAHMLDVFIENDKMRTKVAANSMAMNQDAINAIKRGDGAEIAKVFSAALGLYPIDYFVVCDGNGKILAMTNQPNAVGASLLDAQGTRDALYGKASTYFEANRLVKLSTMTSVPLYSPNGAVVAVISGGVAMESEKTAATLRGMLKTDGTLFVGNSIVAQLPSKEYTAAMSTALYSETVKPLIEKGAEHYGEELSSGEKYKTYYKPLMGANNEHIATALLYSKSSAMAAELKSLVLAGVTIAAIGVLLSKGLMFLLLRSIARRMRQMAHSAEEMAKGNLGVSFQMGSRDEVGSLGDSLQKAADKISKLFDEIFHMISEHKDGNVSFRLVAEDFSGKFEALADAIMGLTNLSIKDRRTGLPNRRTLFSRLVIVRERAVKESSPLSILLVDIDRFKQFGIDMGDAALKKAAQMLSVSIIADVDMVARWAGDIFIVLLPNTAEEGAKHVAERMRARIENCVVESGDGETAKMTASIGAFTIIPAKGDTPDSMIARATEALYSTKGKGGNTIAFLCDGGAPGA
jgi:diguanylate cyclase (GGDEF)-like protein